MLSGPLRIPHCTLGFLIGLSLHAATVPSSQVLSFEEPQAPSSLAATLLAHPTSERAKYGRQSLRWDWRSGSVLRFTHPIDFKPYTPDAESNALSTFVVWVYNTAPSAGSLRFEFGRGPDRDCWFTFGLDFTGWRTCWVAFERDMQGKAVTGMDTLRIIAPSGEKAGTVFLDSLVFSQPVDARHHTRDRQVPFVNSCLPTDANDHWLGLYRFDREPLPELPLPEGALDAARAIGKRYTQLFERPTRLDSKGMEKLRRRFAAWEIRRTPEGIVGRAVAYPHENAAYPAGSLERAESSRENGLQTCSKLLFDLAQAYLGTTDGRFSGELRNMFFDLSDHLLDQGWADGSGMGTLHHLGYNNRLYYPALYFMRDELRASHRLPQIQRAMAWLSGVGKAYGPLNEVNGVSIDTLNTTLLGQIAAQLMIEDETQRARALYATSRWLGRALEPCIGLAGGIKIDGSLLHHANHYPAYAEGGILGGSQALWLFSHTPFRVSESGHASLRQAMLNLRFHSNVLQWPLSLSGRHPNANFTLSPTPYLFLAHAGTPDGHQAYDAEIGAVWRRLADAESRGATSTKRKSTPPSENGQAAAATPDNEQGTLFRGDPPIAPESAPTGHLTLSYATTASHRRENWLATARGFNRYLWGAEIYPNANVFGRYIAYGHVEILARGNPVNLFDSGYSENGWDWNCWPGTTTIHLPLDLLRDRVINCDSASGVEEMLFSDEAFAGGSNLGGRNGLFAMKLHEHGKYDGSHRARKSVFFFDDHLVLLGTDITNSDANHDTRTTLFQQHLSRHSTPLSLDEQSVLTGFPGQFNRPDAAGSRLIDTVGNAYFVLSENTLRITKSPQSSRNNNDRQDTSGDFVLAWLDHGRAPRDAGYAYAILVQPTDQRLHEFSASLGRSDATPFQILRRDHRAHIVQDRETGILALACFEPVADTGLAVDAVDTPALIMLREEAGKTSLSVCDPDLHLYAGHEPDQVTPDGRQKEVSIYSRKWFHADSAVSHVRVTLRGQFVPIHADSRVRTLDAGPDRTTLEFTCQNGLPVEIAIAARD
ncbi:MAG: hypothetical protein KBA71_14070 [Opitutaceae bacterium]|nr:hypothetical protein [Opitutaceae bacterium]